MGETGHTDCNAWLASRHRIGTVSAGRSRDSPIREM